MKIVLRESKTVSGIIKDKTCPLSVVFSQLADSWLINKDEDVLFQHYNDGSVFVTTRLCMLGHRHASFLQGFLWFLKPCSDNTFYLTISYKE